MQDSVQKHLGTAHIRQSNYYNKGRKNIRFKIRDGVMKKNRKLSQATQNYMAKLGPRFIGPFTITPVISQVMYRLTDDYGRVIDKCHIHELKPYNLDEFLQEEQRRNEEEQRAEQRAPSPLSHHSNGRRRESLLSVPGGDTEEKEKRS